MPLPVEDFGHILTDLVDVVLVGDELVVHLLDHVRALVAKLGQVQQGVLDKVEAVNLVLHAHIKWCGNRTLLLIAVDAQVAVGALIGQLMHQRRVAVERKDDGLVLGEQRIVVGIGQAVGVLGVRIQLHQVHDVDDADLQLRHGIAQNCDGGQGLQRRGIAAASHDNVWLLSGVAGRPIPDANTLGAVLDGLFHRQPLGARVLGRDQHVHIVAAADAVVKAAQQAVGVRRQVQAHDIGLFVGDMVQKAGVLVGVAVVVLLPDVGGQNQVQRGDALAPRQLVADLEPLGVLRYHGIHHADEALVAGKEAVSAGEQIALKPTLAHMLGQHRVHDAAVVGQELVAGDNRGVPIALGGLKALVQAVGHRLVRSEDTEVLRVGVQLEDVADVAAEFNHILLLNRTGEWDINGVLLKIGRAQITQQLAAVGVEVSRNAAVALGGQLLQLGNQGAVLIEQFLGMVAVQPLFNLLQMFFLIRRAEGDVDRHLMGAERTLYGLAIDHFRACPALGGAQHDHGPLDVVELLTAAGAALDVVDFLNHGVQRVGHLGVHRHRVIALDEVGLPRATLEEVLDFLMGHAAEHGGVGDLVAVQVQDWQHSAVANGVQELVRLPGSR